MSYKLRAVRFVRRIVRCLIELRAVWRLIGNFNVSD